MSRTRVKKEICHALWACEAHVLCVNILRGHKKDGLFCSFGTSGKRSLHFSLEASKFENIRFAFQSDRKHVENGTFEKNVYYGYALRSLSVFDQKNWYGFQYILSSVDQKYLTQHVQNSTYFSLCGLMSTGLEINVHAWGLRALHNSRQSGCEGD